MSVRVIEETIHVMGLEIATCTWECSIPPIARAILYPGWLDNAGSFYTLAPLLTAAGVKCIAIDPPGCGKSSHLPLSAAYCDYAEVGMLGRLLELLCPVQDPAVPCLLIGHSRGAGVTLAAAGAFKVDGTVLLENENWGIAPWWGNPDDPLERFREWMRSDAKNSSRPTRVFSSLAEAVDFNEKSELFPKSRETAMNIVSRHVVQKQDGKWHFTHDARTYGQNQPVKLSEEQNHSFLAGVTGPVLSIIDKNGFYSPKSPKFDQAFKRIQQARLDVLCKHTKVTRTKLEGGHHLHSDSPNAVCEVVCQWLASNFQLTHANSVSTTRSCL